MSAGRPWAGWLLATVITLAGCAAPPRAAGPSDGAAGPWRGRLALQVEDSRNQSFSAGFELRGSARTGELALFSPLGDTLAVLAWSPGSATLRTPDRSQDFESVDALAVHATGAAIPVAALFDWLRGIGTKVPGWQADLSQLSNGRLRAERFEPAPRADLRMALDR